MTKQLLTSFAVFMNNARQELWDRTKNSSKGKLTLDCYFAIYRDDRPYPVGTHQTRIYLHLTINDDVVFEYTREINNVEIDNDPKKNTESSRLEEAKAFMAIRLMNDCLFLGILEMHRQLMARMPSMGLRKRSMLPQRDEISGYKIERMI